MAIDEKKLIEELENPKNFETQCEITIDDIVGIIKKQPQADKWIPCEERLPSESGCYLVTTDGRYNDIIDIAFYHEGDEVWFKACKILAWTDLPHPYKKEGNSNENT